MANQVTLTGESSLVYQMYHGHYEIDEQDQGYLNYNPVANRGRLISLIEIPLSPIRAAVDVIGGAVCAVAGLLHAVVFSVMHVALMILGFVSSLAPESFIHEMIEMGKTATKTLAEAGMNKVSLFVIGTLPRLCREPLKLIGNIAGTALPEVGRYFRTQENTSLISTAYVQLKMEFNALKGLVDFYMMDKEDREKLKAVRNQIFANATGLSEGEVASLVKFNA